MKKYRTYETYRNAVGGLDPIGTGWEYVESASAADAAEMVAQRLSRLDDCAGVVVVATDDDGESATADVDDYRP